MEAYQKLINLLDDVAEPLSDIKGDYKDLLNKIGDARIVLIGEASHGTREFYDARIAITRELIEKKGFMAVAIEADWPDAYRINRYLQGKGDAANSELALSDFKRFPRWMWRNRSLPPFLKWLRKYNDSLPSLNKIGFYGLDLYSLQSSMEAVIQYLDAVDPEAANLARSRYACFDHAQPDPQSYGYMVTMGLKKSCVKESVEQLMELQHHAFQYIQHDIKGSQDEFFFAFQNARVVKNAEKYYRTMFEGHVASWNVRDEHMAETLSILENHLEDHLKKPAKIIVWAHNSHVGDARATEFGERGELNIGQLARDQFGSDAYLLGFSTYHGSVTAASDWDYPAEHKRVNPGLEGSYEELFHDMKYDNFLLDLKNKPQLEHYLNLPRLQRAIGVIYRPESERASHYFFTKLPYQFDSIIHIDKTTAVEPLDPVNDKA